MYPKGSGQVSMDRLDTALRGVVAYKIHLVSLMEDLDWICTTIFRSSRGKRVSLGKTHSLAATLLVPCLSIRRDDENLDCFHKAKTACPAIPKIDPV